MCMFIMDLKKGWPEVLNARKASKNSSLLLIYIIVYITKRELLKFKGEK